MRTFVAIDFPGEVRDRLWRATAPLREPDWRIRWVGPERLHLTLKFIGEIEEDRADAFGRALDRAVSDIPPFPVRLGGVGAFPSLGRPRVVWLGVDAPPELEALHRAVEEELSALGVDPEDRAFHPHVTLGRVKRGRPEGMEAAAAKVDHEERCRVARVHLKRSRLRPTGAEYSTLSAHELGG